MPNFFQSIKNMFKRNPPPEYLEDDMPGEYYGERSREGSRMLSAYITDDTIQEDDEEVANTTYNSPLRKATVRRSSPIEEAPSPLRSPTPEPKILPTIRESNLSPANNSIRPKSVSVRSENQDSISQRNADEQNRTQPSQSALRDNILAAVKENPPSFPINPNSTLVGFPPNPLKRASQAMNFGRPRQPLQPSRFTPRSRNMMSNYKIDFPIEDVFFDENIPSSMAVKINEAVERDRFGNAYFNHHYAYEPTVQNLTIGNSQQLKRLQHGRRFVREINNYDSDPRSYSEDVFPMYNFNNTPTTIVDSLPQVDYQFLWSENDFNYVPRPINHYTAFALPNDPMRY